MPKMTHWRSRDEIDVSGEKAAVYQAQGWVAVDRSAASKPAAMTTDSVDEAPVKKAPAKKATKKAAKKS